jgi:DNA-binding transcriptional ArsR family regulator
MATRRDIDVQSTAQLFRILGDPSRLRIIMTLFDGEHNVTQICKKLRMSQPTVSRHLSILKMSALAEGRREGKEIYYSVPSAPKRTLKSLLDRSGNLTR